jgi:hypothetical protein
MTCPHPFSVTMRFGSAIFLCGSFSVEQQHRYARLHSPFPLFSAWKYGAQLLSSQTLSNSFQSPIP